MSVFFLLFSLPFLALLSFLALIVVGSRCWHWLAVHYRAVSSAFNELFDYGWRL